MDPIRISRPAKFPDPEPGNVLFIPFEGFNPRIINGKGEADWVLATYLPPFKARAGILEFIANSEELKGRIIEYREYQLWEIGMNPDLKKYVEDYRGRGII